MDAFEIRCVALVGAGTMGARIAFRCAASRLQTYLFDNDPAALDRAMSRIEEWVSERTSEGQFSQVQGEALLGRICPCRSLAQCVGRADLIIETVPENLELKRQVFTEIDPLARGDSLLATNSSSIPCSRLASVTTRPDRIFNINFSDPTRDNLVEVMRGQATSATTIAAAQRFVLSLGMVPIVTEKEIMGFSFNRVWRAIKRECLHLVDQGYSNHEDIDRAWMFEFGTPYGPFGLMDKIGLDVIRDIERQYYADSGDERDKPPHLLDEFIACGRLGVKTGKGFYDYPNPQYREADWLWKKGKWQAR